VGRAVRFVTVALAGLTLTACQDSGTSSTPSASTTSTSPHPAASGSSPRSGPLTTRAAQRAVEGRDYTTLYTVDPHGSSGARVGVRAVRDDGSAVIVNDPPGAGDLIAQSQVGIQNLQSRTLLPPQTGSRPRQAIAAAAHGQSYVWLETKSTDLFYQDWKVFAARVGQRQPTLLGDSFDLTKTDEVPPPPGVEVITTDGEHAWWTMTYPTKSQRLGWGARIMVRDIAGQEPLTTAVDKAKLPAATGGGIAYVRSKDVDPGMPANRYDIRLSRSGADTLVTSGELVKDEQVSTMCASDTLLAWAVHSPEVPAEAPPSPLGRLHVIDLATKAQQTIQLDDSARSLDLSCGDSFVAWGNGSGDGDPGQYVVDVPSSKLWRLGESPGISAVRAAGPMLGWTLPPKGQEAAPWRVTKWHGH
jgi:hypothetical protein